MVARMDFGVLFLLTHLEQREMLRDDPSLIPQAVEEILRMSVPGLGLIPRYASAEIKIDGVEIAVGDLVLLGIGVANRDAGVFEDPDTFDLTRETNPHVAFGYGPRFCIGASLARVELQCAIGALFHRFPTLKLAVPVDDLRLRNHVFTGGLVTLPVTW
jgi:cytochrome P450